MNNLHDQVARETLEGQVIIPDRLPKPRGGASEISALIFVVFMIIVAGLVNTVYNDAFITHINMEGFNTFLDNVVHCIHFGAFCILCGFMGELVWRILLLMEERKHIMGRYDGNWRQLLLDLIHFKRTASCAFGVCVFVMFQKNVLIPWETNPAVQLLMFVCSYISFKLLRLEKSNLMDNIEMEQMSPLDYGSGMALNFFYGYLRLVLPARGNSDKGLKERITEYIDCQKLKVEQFPVQKLFILIPSSTYVPPNLGQMSFDWMEAAETLEPQTRDRAGVIARLYQNSVYKIRDPNKDDPPVYVVAEGATPLKTLQEAVKCSGEKKGFFKRHQKQIILSFYEQLRKILKNDHDCCDLCELIYYVDVDEFDNRNVNAARRILDRIQEIKQKEAELQAQRGEGQ